MESAPPIDLRLMRHAMGQFATGVTVITTVDDAGTPAGCTVSAFSSLSLDPPLVLVCIGNGRLMHGLLTSTPAFAVNVLSARQADLALRFARPPKDRFAGSANHPGRLGIPLLDGAIAHIQCTRYDVLPGGDHAIVIGEVQDIRINEGEPLLYAKGAFLDVNAEAWDRAVADAPHEWLLSAPW
jgi:flavin reductase (DIM6/NTAB) family NADH-FMN oxidoreductase RutF